MQHSMLHHDIQLVFMSYIVSCNSNYHSRVMQVVSNTELERDVIEGKFHNGRAAVIQFIAKKEHK
jgi:hypothetical protein